MSGGRRDHEGKPRVSLIVSKALLEVAKVGTMGAAKYGDHNFRKGMKWSLMLDAAFRHLIRYVSGERRDIDPNCDGCKSKNCKDHSGLSHLAHIAWNILALLEYEIEGVGEDDLFPGYHLTKMEEPDNIENS